MSLIRDNDDERRVRVEALICKLLNAQRQTAAQCEDPARPITYADHLGRAPKDKSAGRAAQ